MSATRVGVYIVSTNRLLRESVARILSRRNDLFAISSDKVSPESFKSFRKMGDPVLLFGSAHSLFQETPAIRVLIEQPTARRIVVLGVEEDAKVFIELVRHGVQGFLLKDASAMDLVAAIRAVARGEVVCPPCLCRFLFERVIRDQAHRPGREEKEASLTRREGQVLPLVARGLTNKEIASQLHIAEQTVKNHVHSILRKTGVEDRVDVLDICHQWGLEIPVEEEIERLS